jgi:hypothetical protein
MLLINRELTVQFSTVKIPCNGCSRGLSSLFNVGSYLILHIKLNLLVRNSDLNK